ncbi:MAG: TlpA disulfide reductase family protein [Acidobacteriota bacterium]|nr:TlpA disulfide reductase family protein [Acidobacteriota bacterium]MDQ7088651.1 TlpA disulfide reductase family protein [Acidobacteriota bacterium]
MSSRCWGGGLWLPLAVCLLACGGPAEPGRVPVEYGLPAQPFVLQTIEGERVSLEDACRDSSVVVLSFWTTWCGPCIHELPMVEALYKRYRDQGVSVLAVEVGSDPELVARLVQTTRVTFPVLLDTNQSVARAFGVRGYPWVVTIAGDCQIIGSSLGPVDNRLSETVARLLAESTAVDSTRNIGRASAAGRELRRRARSSRSAGRRHSTSP